MTAKLLLLFILVVSQFSFFALHQNIELIGSFGDDKNKIEIYTAKLDTDNPNSENNQEVINSLKDDLGYDDKVPVFAETISEKTAAELGVDPLTEESVGEFLDNYKLKNEIISNEVSAELVDYIKSGDMPEGLKEDILKNVLDPNFEKSKEVRFHTNQVTPSKNFLAKKFNLSKSTARLTLVRMAFNGAVGIFASSFTRRVDIKTLSFALITMSMTGAVQVNNKFFEKIMSHKFAKAMFFGIEAAFVATTIAASSLLFGADHSAPLTDLLLQMTNSGVQATSDLIPQAADVVLSIPENSKHWVEIGLDIFGIGAVTTFTQGRAEELAAKQIDKSKDYLDAEAIRSANDDKLSKSAKAKLMDVLAVKKANLTETFSRVMLGGSMIWGAAIAAAATVPDAYGLIATYSVFGVLHVYANTIKYVGSDKMMSLHVADYERGIIDFWKAQFRAPGKVLNNVAKSFKKMYNKVTCNSKFLK